MKKLPDIERRLATREEQEAVEITREWLEQRVEVDERGCWVWQGYITKRGQPQTRITISPKVSATMMVRRLVAKMNWKPTKVFKAASTFMRGRQAGVADDCSWGCCRPEHVVMRTKKLAMRKQKGKPLTTRHRMRISASRKKNSRISDADVLAMLSDPRPGNVVAAEFGVHQSYVPHVRVGKLRKFSSIGMFSGLLGAANDQEKARA